MSRARAGSGFTLLEVLAVVALTAVVLTIALDFYMEMSRSQTRALAYTRDIRRATAILDRVARDFQGAAFVRKAPEEDPLYHPWVFIGESRSSGLGADHVRFVTRNHVPRGSETHEADLATVSYLTRESFDAGLELRRHSSPGLVTENPTEFPLADDEDVLLLADGLVDFGVRFLGDDGEPQDEWNSAQLVDSGELPRAVEIELAIADDNGFFGEEGVASFSRLVVLPVRPLDPSDFTEGEDGALDGADGDGQGQDGEDGADGDPDSLSGDDARDGGFDDGGFGRDSSPGERSDNPRLDALRERSR